MHELTITQNIVAIATEYSQGAKIYKISLEIGKLSAVMPEAIEFCFDVCCRGTPLENADLEIVEIAGKGRCRCCGTEMNLEQPFGVCICGSTDIEIIQGQELKIRELEAEELCV